MPIEKQGRSAEHDIGVLIKKANDEEKLLVVEMNGLFKYASGKHKRGVAVFATGTRAIKLLEILNAIIE